MTDQRQCVLCEYDLRGLQSPGRCPECGFAFGPSICAWRSRRRSRVSAASWICLVLLTIGWGLRVLWPTPAAMAGNGHSIWIGLGLLGFAVDIAWKTFAPGQPFVVLTERALILGNSGTRALHEVPWAEVRELRQVAVGRRTFLHLRVRGRRWPIDVSPIVTDEAAELSHRVGQLDWQPGSLPGNPR